METFDSLLDTLVSLTHEAGELSGRDSPWALDKDAEAQAARAKVLQFFSEGNKAWIETDTRSPEDEQTVLGYWPNVGVCTPFYESVTYYAKDAPDGPEAWRNAWGEVTDPPDYWMPQNALKGPQ